MISIRTNASAMTALESLTATQKNLATTQARISTGLKVGNASDNAAYWSIATTMKSDSSALSTVSDALNLGASTIDVASNGLKAALDVTSSIKTKLVAARQPGVDRTAVQAEITQLQKQLKSIGDSASFSGQNWLSIDSTANGGNTTKSIVSSFQNGAVSTIGLDVKNIALFDSNAAAAQDRYNVTVNTSGAAGLQADVAAKMTGAGTGDSASIVLSINGKDQAATAKFDGTNYDISYTSNEIVDSSSTQAATVKVGVKGSATAADTVDYTATGVVTKTQEFVDNSNGILSALGTSGKAVAAFDAAGALSTNSMDISKLTDSTTDLAQLDKFIKDVDKSINKMTTAGSNLGSVKSRVTLQQDFVKSLMNSLDKGISSLVDADMTEESTRLSALQVQSQLGTQAMSIANSSTQGILSLFRG
jgi:flagellin